MSIQCWASFIESKGPAINRASPLKYVRVLLAEADGSAGAVRNRRTTFHFWESSMFLTLKKGEGQIGGRKPRKVTIQDGLIVRCFDKPCRGIPATPWQKANNRRLTQHRRPVLGSPPESMEF
jgi:hypothetical protein